MRRLLRDAGEVGVSSSEILSDIIVPSVTSFLGFWK